jgi:YbbR domain-containing protein
MKEKLTRNIGLKILSIILAAILWLVITNIDNPIVTKNINNVPVTILNENVINKINQVYEITEGSTINFTVAARRSIADNLTAADFKVTADFSKLSEVHAVPIDITCLRNADAVVVTEGKYQMMKINLEDLQKANFKVSVQENGEVAEGYFVGEKRTSPNIIRVSGPKSKIDRIKNIIVETDVSEYSKSFAVIGEVKAVDENGKEIDKSNLKFNEKYVTVNISVYKKKKIDLKINTTGEPANGYVMTGIEYEPKTIEIAGEDTLLKSINSLVISEDISGATENIEKPINLQEYLEEGIMLVGDDQNVEINISIKKKQTKEVAIWPGDLELKHKPDISNLSFLTTGQIMVTLSGPEDELAGLARSNVKPYIDLENCTLGTYSLAIGFSLPEHVTVVNNPKVTVYLSR